MEDEKPNLNETFEQVSEINFGTEFYLEDNALEGMTAEEAELEIAEQLKKKYEKFNPFEEAETELTVEIKEICENSNTLEIDETGKACEVSSSRKRRGLFKTFKKIGGWFKKAVAKCATTYKSTKQLFAQMSNLKLLKLGKSIAEVAKNIQKEVQNFKNGGVRHYINTLTCSGGVSEHVGNILWRMTYKENSASVSAKKAPSNEKFHLHNWMSSLSQKMRKVPLTMLAIPGTHNSATHQMRNESLQAYDSPWYSPVPMNSSALNNELAAWGRCVKHNITEQLTMGIRYYDFRL